jgi:GGDEF domain-containing protein
MTSPKTQQLFRIILEHASKLPFDKSITPKTDINSLIGYSYGFEEMLGTDCSYDSVFLKKLEENNYLQGDFFDKILLCPYCLAYNMSFRDICPECSSAHLETVKMIHHFRCGYMGYESEFFNNNKLVCPKCSLELKYIGKDYENPTEVYRCLDCNWTGAEILTSGHCIACDKESLPENCIITDINSYRITPHGKLALKTDNIKIKEKEEFIELPSRDELNTHFSQLAPLLSLTNAMGLVYERHMRPMLGISILPDVFSNNEDLKPSFTGVSTLPNVLSKIQNPALQESLTNSDELKLKMYLSDTISEGTSKSSDFSLMLLKEIQKIARELDFISPLSNNGYFGILLETNIENGILFTERLCKKINSLKFGGTFTQTTLSIGIAEWTKSNDAIDLLINSNKAMMESVHAGGNRVTVFEKESNTDKSDVT